MKRLHAVAASSDAADFQSDEGGPQPTLLLHLSPEDFSSSRYLIRPVASETAQRWFARFHYLAKPGVGVHWGVFAPDLMALVSLGQPNNDHGVAGRFGLSDIPGNVEINRVAVHPSCPTHTSRVIRLVLRVAARDLSWVLSYADPAQGHHGGIYQALGAVYVGLGWPAPASFIIGGQTMHPRSVVHKYGTMGVAKLRGLGVEFERTKKPDPKHTYILPLGERADEVRTRLRPHGRAYPKRAAA